MQNSKTLAQIFENEPAQWGLRGDPYLWNEMKERLGSHVYPANGEDLFAILEQTFEQLTGSSIKVQAPIFVERYNRGGMSGGQVDPHFWTEIGLPLLLARYQETR